MSAVAVAVAVAENVVVSVDPSLAVSGSVSVTVGDILAVMKTASDEEMADLMAEMWRGSPIFQERCRAAGTLVEEAGEEVATPVKAAKKAVSPKAPAAPKKAAKPKKEALPLPEGDEAPTAASYRLEASEIKEELCQARKLEGGVDKRWSPAVYTETQCKRKPVEGSELCQLCSDCFEKESQDEKFKKWFGLITEEPESTTHMLGTTWAAKCKWVGVGTASAAPASPALPTGTAEGAAEDGEESAAAAPAPAPKKEVKAPAPKKEVKAKAPAKAKAAKPIVAVLPAAAAADASEPVTVAVAGELTLIGGDFYWVADGKVYSYDQIEDKQGEYKGRLTKEETIDESIAEDD